MRTIAITKSCLEYEKDIILSSVEEDDKILFFESERELLESEDIANIDVVFGEPELNEISLMKKLRWIQMTWAGANKYTGSPKLLDHIVLTSASGAYGVVISEYIISSILALYRSLFLYRAQMKDGKGRKIEHEDTLEGKRVLILGTGNIGQETARKLKCFEACTVGIRRSAGEGQPFFDELYTIEKFDEERINRMKPNSMLVNVGRGFIVNTDALTNALCKGMLKGAVLDVTDPEPLPETHPLRYMENVVLTPHISGIGWGENRYTRKRILEIFCENIRRDSKNEMLKNVIDFNKGY